MLRVAKSEVPCKAVHETVTEYAQARNQGGQSPL